MSHKPVHFKVPTDQNEHHAWCGCGWKTAAMSGPQGQQKTRRWSREHVAETGHEVRIDVTRQHGYRPDTTSPNGHTGQRS